MKFSLNFGPLRATLFLFLILTTLAILYTTYQNTQSAKVMADQALESTGSALASTLEAELRSGDTLAADHVRRILSDRIIAYALVADREGLTVFHTNSGLIGMRLKVPGMEEWLKSGQAYGRRVILGTGLPAYEFNYPLHLQDGRVELLRFVLHTQQADQIMARAKRMWGTVGLVLLVLWTIGILFERLLVRQLQLQQAFQKREQLAAIGQMTATLAHETRNALGGIKGYTQWVDEKIEPGDPKKTGLAMALKGIGRIESLVEDLLRFARTETYNLQSLLLEKILNEVIQTEFLWNRQIIQIRVKKGLTVMADGDKLHQILSNGLRNALQAMEKDPQINLVAESQGKWTLICIEDKGPGLTDAEKEKLFTPFYTTKTTGTGLGLAYSRKVIEGMGGTITLENRSDGEGAVLTVKLPRGER